MGRKIIKLNDSPDYVSLLKYVNAEFSWLFKVLPDVFVGFKENLKFKAGRETYFENLEDIVHNVKTNHKLSKVNLVGHSLGGLKIMNYCSKFLGDIDNCVTIASPFGGTFFYKMGYLAPLFGLNDETIFEMKPGDFLEDLSKKIKNNYPLLEEIKFKNICGDFDEFISLKNSSLIEFLGSDKENIEEYVLKYQGHASVFDNYFTYDLIKDILKSSVYPLIMVHGYCMNKNFFNPFINHIKNFEPELQKKIYVFSYNTNISLKK